MLSLAPSVFAAEDDAGMSVSFDNTTPNPGDTITALVTVESDFSAAMAYESSFYFDKELLTVAVLTALPVGNVRLHTQQPVFHLSHGFICGNGNHVDGEHHVPVQVGQLGYEIILNIAGVVLEVQHPCEPIPNLEIVAVPLDGIRADVVPEAVTLPGLSLIHI